MDLRKQDKQQEQERRIPQIVRSARFLETSDGWFFRTREDIMLGPYADRFDAELSASLLVARLAQLEPGHDPAPMIKAFENDPANATKQQAQRFKPVDLKAIRRKHALNNALPTFARAWSAITQIKVIHRN